MKNIVLDEYELIKTENKKIEGVKTRGEQFEMRCNNVICSNPSYQIKHAQL